MSKRKTQEEFVNEIKIKHPNIEILGQYLNAKTNILCKCKIDEYMWSPTPSSLSSGYGCPKCSGNAKKTNDEFILEVKNINSNIIILGKYNGANKKVKCKCKLDDFEWEATPANILSGKGCPKCAKRNTSNRMSLSKEDFLKNINNYNIKNNTFWTTNDKYVNSRMPMNFYCKKDNFHIVAKSSNLLSGYYRCIECDRVAGEKRLLEHIKNNHLPIEIIGEYTNTSTVIKCKCKICNNEYYVTPNRILVKNAICRKCAYIKMGINARLPLEDFLNKLSKVNPNIQYIGNYSGMSNKVDVLCKKCGHKWSPFADSIINENKGCPNCCISKGENRIEEVLKYYKIEYEIQKTFNGLVGIGNLKMRYDFYLPKYNLLIEYQGIQHEKPVDFSGRGEEFAQKCFINQQEHDKRKRQYAKIHDIKLLEIWYHDFNNIEQILLKELCN